MMTFRNDLLQTLVEVVVVAVVAAAAGHINRIKYLKDCLKPIAATAGRHDKNI